VQVKRLKNFRALAATEYQRERLSARVIRGGGLKTKPEIKKLKKFSESAVGIGGG
jgi:hypothetical protein